MPSAKDRIVSPHYTAYYLITDAVYMFIVYYYF
jgi:hypothetical protein